jgi:uncharacterized OB-fold protein
MPLIKCKECGQQMSDSAKACPHCGANMLQAVGITTAQKFAAWAFVVAGALLVLVSKFSEEGTSFMWLIGVTGVACGIYVLKGKNRKA